MNFCLDWTKLGLLFMGKCLRMDDILLWMKTRDTMDFCFISSIACFSCLIIWCLVDEGILLIMPFNLFF